jgi:hypothetical protein
MIELAVIPPRSIPATQRQNRDTLGPHEPPSLGPETITDPV